MILCKNIYAKSCAISCALIGLNFVKNCGLMSEIKDL